MPRFLHQSTDPDAVHALGDRLLHASQAIADLRLVLSSVDGDAQERLTQLTRECLTLSGQASTLATRTAMSSAACTVDGREAIGLLTRMTAAASAGAIHVTAAMSALDQGDRAGAEIHVRTALGDLQPIGRTSWAAADALTRHEGVLNAQLEAEIYPFAPEAQPEQVTEPQRQALAHIAQGTVILHSAEHGRPRELREAGAVRLTTVDALQKRKLITLTAHPDDPERSSVALTSAGRHVLLAANSARPGAATTTPAPAGQRAERAGGRHR
ncbi:hypothetical protein AB0C52_25080 [Streptomyces sp. NPDC048717]|uniref:hypothetical protein n=1 Tax=Streptomyces sp. NPDC048717 TaxID=3154928 RepID=UPI00343BEDA5